jgi:hypothetical protein
MIEFQGLLKIKTTFGDISAKKNIITNGDAENQIE